jgi:predicted transcriptional regulator
MNKEQIITLIKRAKEEKHMTINEIASESNVAVRTVNRILAGEDVRYSSLVSVLETLELSIHVEKKAA